MLGSPHLICEASTIHPIRSCQYTLFKYTNTRRTFSLPNTSSPTYLTQRVLLTSLKVAA